MTISTALYREQNLLPINSLNRASTGTEHNQKNTAALVNLNVVDTTGPDFGQNGLSGIKAAESVSKTSEKNGVTTIQTNKNNQIKNQAGAYEQAAKMERSRAKILEIIVNDSYLLALFADCYLIRKEQGCDLSEILTLSNHKQKDDPVQDNDFVQHGVKQMETELQSIFETILSGSIEKLSEASRHLLIEIHFLPAFVNWAAERIAAHQGLDKFLKKAIVVQQKQMMQAREAMIQGNVRLVTYTAKQYRHTKLAFEDLLQEGSIGLIKAVDRFDYRRDVKFSTYAVYWIRQTISRLIIKQEKLVRLPFSLAAKAAMVFDIMHTRLEITNRWPSAVELANVCQISEQEVITLLKFYQPGMSLNTPVNNDEDMPDLVETLEQSHYPMPFNALSEYALRVSIDKAIDSLSQREADILRARFGIQNCVEMTLQEIADQLHLSRERVRQIQNSAINKIKNCYGPELHDFFSPHYY